MSKGSKNPVVIVSSGARIVGSADGASFVAVDEDEQPVGNETAFASLRAALLAHPEVFLEDCSVTVTGIETDRFAALLSVWEVPGEQFEINDEYYTRVGGMVCPFDPTDRPDTVEVARRVFTRYGGDFGPCSTEDGFAISHTGAFWFVEHFEHGWTPIGWFEDPEDGLAASVDDVIFTFGTNGQVLPALHGEDDAVWWENEVYVLRPEGIRRVAEPYRAPPEDPQALLPVRVRWATRGSGYEMLAGTVFTGETEWHALIVNPDAAAIEAPFLPPLSACAVVLLYEDPEIADPLWLSLTRLATAAREWGVDQCGEALSDLRPPPAVAELADGSRRYGVIVPSFAAGDICRAFGQPCWLAQEADQLVARYHDGSPLAALPCEQSPAPAPVEGDLLWDDERFGGARSVLDYF